jgi:RNA polymerase sigma-70 factor (ECF subfamily)
MALPVARTAEPSAAGADAWAAVVERARLGERGAWDQLILRYNPLVLAVFVRMAIAVARGQELSQEVWLRLFCKARDGALAQLVMPGLALREARYRALDELRGRGAEESLDDRREALGDEPADPAPSAEAQVASRDELERLRRVLSALPPRQREVLQLALVQGVPHAQIAQQLGISEQRSKQTLTEARARVRALCALPPAALRAHLCVVVDGDAPEAAARRLGISRDDLHDLLCQARDALRAPGSR